ncbi:MAG: hypothetical protein U0795_25505 [Pirellulales bacterium]
MTPLVLTTGGTTEGLRLELTLTWLGDRYGQRLVVINELGERCEVAESCEGTADDLWPPAPPLQQVLMHTIADQVPAALGVGMAGTSHWSVSIEADPREPRIVWDVACRCQPSAPGRLHSTFRRIEPPSLDDLPCGLRPVPLDIPEAGPAIISSEGRQTEFRPAAGTENSPSGEWTTVRWRFAWEISGRSAP